MLTSQSFTTIVKIRKTSRLTFLKKAVDSAGKDGKHTGEKIKKCLKALHEAEVEKKSNLKMQNSKKTKRIKVRL